MKQLSMFAGMPTPAPLSDLERGIVSKLSNVRFPPYTASKRFARDLASGYVVNLSDRGRAFLAFIVHRFRRQLQLSEEEWQWVRQWLNREAA